MTSTVDRPWLRRLRMLAVAAGTALVTLTVAVLLSSEPDELTDGMFDGTPFVIG